ncbi:MAG: hypothetical protein WBA23_11025 [Tunicatimonas sp.]|uniref:hypothetical protein n=1 Tax=Tunicatimonas sp. TaxID=1940096 RepID=UPI003C733874
MKSITFIISLFTVISIAQAQDISYEAVAFDQSDFYEADAPYEGKIPLGEHEIPKKVLSAFQTSVFQHTEIVQVFLLQDEGLQEAIGEESSDQPSQLYEFQLRFHGKSFQQYFTDEGDLYIVPDSV